jgi:hypothetical protein
MRKFARKFPKHKRRPDFCRFFSVHCKTSFAARSAINFFWLGPIRNLLSFVVFASFFSRRAEVARPVLSSGGRQNTRLLRMRSKP